MRVRRFEVKQKGNSKTRIVEAEEKSRTSRDLESVPSDWDGGEG